MEAVIVPPPLAQEPGGYTCVICVEVIEGPVVRLACRCRESLFCGDCFQQYVDAQYRVCPLCKQPMDDGHAFPYFVGYGRERAGSRVSPSSVAPVVDFGLGEGALEGGMHSQQEYRGLADMVRDQQESVDETNRCFCCRHFLFRLWYYSFWGYWVMVNLLVYERGDANGLLYVVGSLGNVMLEIMRLVFIGKWKLEPPCYVVQRSRCFRAHYSVIYLSGLMDMLIAGACLALSFESNEWSYTLLMLLVGRLAYLLMAMVFSACAFE